MDEAIELAVIDDGEGFIYDADSRNRVGIGLASMQAVSYTHLRAHETVLDIVCRLLLEKKNYRTPLRRLRQQ